MVEFEVGGIVFEGWLVSLGLAEQLAGVVIFNHASEAATIGGMRERLVTIIDSTMSPERGSGDGGRRVAFSPSGLYHRQGAPCCQLGSSRPHRC